MGFFWLPLQKKKRRKKKRKDKKIPFHRYSLCLATSPRVPGNWLAATSHSWEHFGAAVAVVLILVGMRGVRDGMDGITTVCCSLWSSGDDPSAFLSAADWLGMENSASQPFGASKKFQGMEKMWPYQAEGAGSPQKHHPERE